MIRVEKIEIEEFRGIRKLVITPNLKNLGIAGPNGTGKSGVVDAIEFALTGSITRLAGRGTSDISVKQHAAHVDSAKKPNNSIVRLTVRSLDGNKVAVIERSVGTPNAPKITTPDAKLQAALEDLAAHPEFALSRREIVKYILTPPGQRATDVQDLLRLEQIEDVRKALKRIANDTDRDEKQAQQTDDRAKAEFLKALALAKLSKSELLAAVNERRKLLGLPAIEDFTATTDLADGVVAAGGKEGPAKIHKATAVTDLSDFWKEIELGDSDAITAGKDAAGIVLTRLADDAALLANLQRQALVQQGLGLVTEPACPLCDTAWDMEALRAHLNQKLTDAKEADELLRSYTAAIIPLTTRLSDMETRMRKLIGYCALLVPKIETDAPDLYASGCRDQAATLKRFTGTPENPAECQTALGKDYYALTEKQTETLSALGAALAALPDPSKEEEAKAFLIIAQERLKRCRATKAELESATARKAAAAAVLDAYAKTSNAVLEGIYAAVEDDFTRYYRTINHDDEGQFDGKLTPSLGKLAFDVDFYGRGLFPPGAYHSEGHQDGMGLCLYLALMKHTLGDKFTMCVLDDVLMSVDAGHRREVCRLLKAEIPNTQFILTTHDPVWLQFMKTESLIGSSVSFGGWTVEGGPNVWVEGDVWKKIDDQLAKNDVPSAASTLRRYMEFSTTIMAANLRAPVDFQSDGQYDLGDLLPPALSQFKKLLASAKEAATSWGQTDAIKAIEEVEKDLKTKVAQSQVEQWMINKAVHYNVWHNLQKAEFEVVVSAFKALLATMRCSEALCMDFLHVVPRKGAKESLRCDCGTLNYNLKKSNPMVKRSRYDELHDRYHAILTSKAGTRYERLAAMVFKILEKSSVVIHDLKLLGDSTVAHQIDVVFEVNGNRRRVVLECKDFDISGASVDLDILRSFRSVIEDRQADEGIVVTSNAYTREAQKYAKSKNIKLAILRQITPEDLEGLIQKIIIDMHVQSNHNHQADLHIEAADHDLFQAELARVGLAGGGGIHSGDPVYVVLGSEKTQFTEFLSSQVSSQPAAKTENGRWQVRTASNGRSLQVNDGPLIRFGGVVTTYDIVIEKFPMEISSNRIAEMIVSGLGSDDIIIFDDQIKAFQIDEDTGEIRGAAANQA